MENRCTNCGEILVERKIKWLELSITDGNYYPPENFPYGHESQGSFPFGTSCATAEIKKTVNQINPPAATVTAKEDDTATLRQTIQV
jgi:hypothetical protein